MNMKCSLEACVLEHLVTIWQCRFGNCGTFGRWSLAKRSIWRGAKVAFWSYRGWFHFLFLPTPFSDNISPTYCGWTKHDWPGSHPCWLFFPTLRSWMSPGIESQNKALLPWVVFHRDNRKIINIHGSSRLNSGPCSSKPNKWLPECFPSFLFKLSVG